MSQTRTLTEIVTACPECRDGEGHKVELERLSWDPEHTGSRYCRQCDTIYRFRLPDTEVKPA